MRVSRIGGCLLLTAGERRSSSPKMSLPASRWPSFKTRRQRQDPGVTPESTDNANSRVVGSSEVGPKRAYLEAPNSVPNVLTKVNSLLPNTRLVIAFHSLDGLVETGLRMYPPEKSQASAPLRYSFVRFLSISFCG